MKRVLLTMMLMVLSLPAAAQPAPNAHPTGGTVVGGSATLSFNGTTTTITQSTQRAAVNWQDFDVGSQQTVTFAQPSSSAAILNRVVGPDPSQIAGKIDANGQVVLVNQSGVTFYDGAQVNAAGLVVSTADVTTKNFMAGKLAFSEAGGANAAIVNDGAITIADAGLAALVAPRVANAGTITAKEGRVILAGVKTATIDLFGDGLLTLADEGAVTQKPSGATALVTNSGTISAQGGKIELTAKAVDGVIENLIQAGGTVKASSVVLRGVGGAIVVTGSGYGSAKIQH